MAGHVVKLPSPVTVGERRPHWEQRKGRQKPAPQNGSAAGTLQAHAEKPTRGKGRRGLTWGRVIVMIREPVRAKLIRFHKELYHPQLVTMESKNGVVFPILETDIKPPLRSRSVFL